MDKITLFDVLSFLVPGALFLGIIHIFKLLNNINTTSVLIENQPILSSFLFLTLSYILGFVISNIANYFYKWSWLKNTSFSTTVNIPKNRHILTQLDKYSLQDYEFGFIENEKINENNLNNLQALWYETLEMKTTHSKSRVLHSHFRMFSNIFFIIFLSIIAYIITAIHLYYFTSSNIFSFKFITFGCILILFLHQAYRIKIIRFDHFSKSILDAIFVYYSHRKYEENLKNNQIKP